MFKQNAPDLKALFSTGTIVTEQSFGALIDYIQHLHRLLGRENLDGSAGPGPGLGLEVGEDQRLRVKLQEHGGLEVDEHGLSAGVAGVDWQTLGVWMHGATHAGGDQYSRVFMVPSADNWAAYVYSLRGTSHQSDGAFTFDGKNGWAPVKNDVVTLVRFIGFTAQPSPGARFTGKRIIAQGGSAIPSDFSVEIQPITPAHGSRT